MMGGASENDSAMAWFLRQAYGGDVLVLRASGSNGYNAYMLGLPGVGLNSVESIVCNNASSEMIPGWFAALKAPKPFGLQAVININMLATGETKPWEEPSKELSSSEMSPSGVPRPVWPFLVNFTLRPATAP